MYNLVVCGGTFDHFNKGHREFLRYALSKSLKLLIGLTTDAYVKEKNKTEGVDSYRIRKLQLEKFLKEEKALEKISITPIDSVFIPKIWESLPIEAIIVSENTVLGAEKVNLKRKEQKKYPLKIEVCPLIKNENNEYISSSKIRKGEIDSEGKSYINPLWLSHKLFISESVRAYVKMPLGKLLKNNDIPEILKPASPRGEQVQNDNGDPGSSTRMTDNPYIITVGDVTTKTFNDLGFNQDISVIDFKVARKKKFSSLAGLGFSGGEKIFKVNNPAGCITPSLFKAISKIFKLKEDNQRIILQIEGEEDLSVLPLILGVPLGSVIFYGQPNEGIVMVNVSEKTKKVAYSLIDQFKKLY